MKTLDRLLTIVVTATLTSAAWILFGSAYTSAWLDEDRGEGGAAASAGQTGPGSEIARGPAGRDGGPPTIIDSSALAGTMIIPVEGVRASQLFDSFTEERGDERLHAALDIAAPLGTRVVAAAPGKVERLFQSDDGGNTIYVRSTDGRTIYYYAHLDAYAPDIEDGDAVQRGQVLGTVGFSGNASPEAPHLHFAVLRTTPDADWWEPATPINPYPLLAGAN